MRARPCPHLDPAPPGWPAPDGPPCRARARSRSRALRDMSGTNSARRRAGEGEDALGQGLVKIAAVVGQQHHSALVWMCRGCWVGTNCIAITIIIIFIVVVVAGCCDSGRGRLLGAVQLLDVCVVPEHVTSPVHRKHAPLRRDTDCPVVAVVDGLARLLLDVRVPAQRRHGPPAPNTCLQCSLEKTWKHLVASEIRPRSRLYTGMLRCRTCHGVTDRRRSGAAPRRARWTGQSR